MPVVGNNECRCSYPQILTENMLCAGLKDGGEDACQVNNAFCLFHLLVTEMLFMKYVQTFKDTLNIHSFTSVTCK